MLNQLVSKYLHQTQELFGNTLYFSNKDNDVNFYKFGDINSDIVFIKKKTSDKDEQMIFNKILKALNLSEDQIFIIDYISNIKSDKKLRALIRQLNPKIIVSLGSHISQFILSTNENVDSLRIKNNFLKEAKVIPTYSLKNIKNNLDLKRRAWNDLKVIL